MRRSAEQRFWSKVDKRGPYTGLVAGRCHDWTGALSTDGYGQFWYNGRMVNAHRFTYGPVPRGLELDHLCKRPVCVRSSHLRAVTHRKNILVGDSFAAVNAVKTHCPAGHPLSGDNLRTRRGKRSCRKCEKTYSKRYREKRRAAA